MSDVRIIKRELVVRLTTAKGSVLYEPAEPDTYLQAIKDAWNDRNEYQRADIYGYWPEFSDLLDALTEENEDG